MVSVVVAATFWIGIVPLLVIDRDSHFRWITMIQAGSRSIVLVPPEVLWVIDIRIVVESFPVLGTVRTTPDSSISSIWCLGFDRGDRLA